MNNYKVAFLTSVFPNSVFRDLKGDIFSTDLCYQDNYNKVSGKQLLWSDSHAKYFSTIGHECETFFFNFKELQEQWADEHSLKYKEETWLLDILIEQLKKFQPDIIYINDMYTLNRSYRSLIREVCSPNIKIGGWRFAYTEDPSVLSDLDFIVTGNKNWVSIFQPYCRHVVYSPLYFQPDSLNEIEKYPEEEKINFSFVGAVGAPNAVHSSRYFTLEKMLERTDIEVWGNRKSSFKAPNALTLPKDFLIYNSYKLLKTLGGDEFIPKIPIIRRAVNWQSFRSGVPLEIRFKHRFHGSVYGNDNYEVIKNSKLVFNKHTDIIHKYGGGGNMRMFEATGFGSCLLTDHFEGIEEFFEPDSEILVYKSIEEAVEKANYILAHDEERKRIALAGKQRTLKDYSTKMHMERINEVFNRLMRG